MRTLIVVSSLMLVSLAPGALALADIIDTRGCLGWKQSNDDCYGASYDGTIGTDMCVGHYDADGGPNGTGRCTGVQGPPTPIEELIESSLLS